MDWRRLPKVGGGGFLLGMASAVALATLAPTLGTSDGPLHAGAVADAGVFAVFFLHGVGLSTEKLREGVTRWRVHLFVQASTFVLFPALFLLFRAAVGRFLPGDLLLGFLYLCALPSTISSSVALTAVAGGNVAVALFNATLSSILGVFLTPALVELGVPSGGALDLGEAIGNVARLLLLPLVLGQACRPWVGGWFGRHRRITQLFDRGVILLLVYVSFAESVAGGLWSRYGLGTLATTLLGVAALLAIILQLTTSASRALGFSTEDEIAAVFCGSKKTLASGVPMARLLFGDRPGIGLIVLPIMLYHQLQLVVCTVLAERYARRVR